MEAAVMTNTLVVKECYGLFQKRNIPALIEHLSDDVQWNESGPKEVLPWTGSYKGKAQVGEFFKLLDQHMEFTKFEPREFIEQGNRVITLGYSEGKSKKTGNTFSSEWAMAFTLKNGKITDFRDYNDTYAAYKAFHDTKNSKN